jgi:hypothetical protein
MPKAIPRLLPVYDVVSIDSVDGEAMAAPRPCTILPVSITERSAEAPVTREPSMKVAMPATKSLFLPNWSPNLPHMRMKAPNTSE